MPRRFVTKAEIDALADRGETRLEIDDRTTVTDVARERAAQRGVAVVRPDAPGPQPPAPPGTGSVTRSVVRSRVLAELGEAPPGLDEALDRVLGR
ncbi:hypothetical protein [Nocardioides humi]|uniref:Lsr2 protein n=1 Tax=Nocardioides humi TaxID=449461 RepID=A0ABN2BJF8_9ACTN|nr:hypothetical protein [Nocardioides humi]